MTASPEEQVPYIVRMHTRPRSYERSTKVALLKNGRKGGKIEHMSANDRKRVKQQDTIWIGLVVVAIMFIFFAHFLLSSSLSRKTS